MKVWLCVAVCVVAVLALSQPVYAVDEQVFDETELLDDPFWNRVMRAVDAGNRTLRRSWDAIKDVWNKTIESVFGKEPFWDRTYEFLVPPQFRKLTFEQFAKWANGASAPSRPPKHAFLQMEAELNSYETPLPENYSFYDAYPMCVKKSWDQGRCGSCWAFSTAGAITHRLCRAIKDANADLQFPSKDASARLSPQLLVSCVGQDVAKAPCNGGNVFGAYNWVSTNYLNTVACCPYKSWYPDAFQPKCQEFRSTCDKWGTGEIKKKDKTAAIKVSVEKVRFVFGEEAMKRAIFERGPISVTMKTPSNFIGASGKGVFSRGSAPFLMSGQTHAYHAVVILGWGVEDVKGTKIPYWILENSWGDIYWSKFENGHKGMLKVIRGKPEEMEIELNLHVEADVVIKKGDEKVSVADGWWKLSQGNPAALAVSSLRLPNGDLNIPAVEQAADKIINQVDSLVKDGKISA